MRTHKNLDGRKETIILRKMFQHQIEKDFEKLICQPQVHMCISEAM